MCQSWDHTPFALRSVGNLQLVVGAQELQVEGEIPIGSYTPPVLVTITGWLLYTNSVTIRNKTFNWFYAGNVWRLADQFQMRKNENYQSLTYGR